MAPTRKPAGVLTYGLPLDSDSGERRAMRLACRELRPSVGPMARETVDSGVLRDGVDAGRTAACAIRPPGPQLSRANAMRPARPQPRLPSARRILRREAARGAALLLGFALVIGVLRSGSRYLYCPFMGAVVREHCCSTAPPERESTVEQPDCCESRTLGAMPATRAAAPRSELTSAPLLTVLAPAPILQVVSNAVLPKRLPAGGSGLSPPPARRPARLMVFLI
jgi:hypothetical protein